MDIVASPIGIPPAGKGTVDTKATSVTVAHVDGGKDARWQRSTTDVVVAPASHCTVGTKTTTRFVPQLYAGEGSRQQRRLIRIVLIAPANHRPVGAQPTGVIFRQRQLGKGIRRSGKFRSRRLSLAMAVVAPTDHRPIRTQSTVMRLAGADLLESASGWILPTIQAVPSPADNLSSRPQCASVLTTGTDRYQIVHPVGLRHPCGHSISPAHGGPSQSHCAGMGKACADRVKLAILRHRLPVKIIPPALNRAGGSQSAYVLFARADCGEFTVRGGQLLILVATPTRHRPIRPDPASVSTPRVYDSEFARRWRGLAVAVVTPASHRTFRHYPAGMLSPGIDSSEPSLRRTSTGSV